MLTRLFWLGDNGVLVRAIRTWAQTGVSLLGVQQFSVFQLDWKNFLGITFGAAFVSLLMSLDRAESRTDPTSADYQP
jgi:hypothetical protein